jgi:hypothetical protein
MGPLKQDRFHIRNPGRPRSRKLIIVNNIPIWVGLSIPPPVTNTLPGKHPSRPSEPKGRPVRSLKTLPHSIPEHEIPKLRGPGTGTTPGDHPCAALWNPGSPSPRTTSVARGCPASFCYGTHAPIQASMKFLRCLARLGWRSFRRAFASIWRIRSRVTSKSCPTSSSV